MLLYADPDGTLRRMVDGHALREWTPDEPPEPAPEPEPDPPDPGPWTPGAQPNNSNVGLPGVGNPALTAGGSVTTGTHTRRRWTGNLTITANDVTLDQCEITGELIVRGDRFTATDCDMGALSLSGTADVSIERARVYGMTPGKDGIHITSDTGRCQDITIADTYVACGPVHAGQHYDGIQVRGVDRLKLLGVHFNATPNGAGGQAAEITAAIFLQDAQGGNDDVLVQGCWVRSGGGFLIYQFGTNVEIRDCVFYRSPESLPLYPGHYPFTESGNTWDNGAPMDWGLAA